MANSHVIEYILHGLAVRQGARGIVSAHAVLLLLSPLALVRMEQQDQLLLNLLPLFRVRCSAWGLLLLLLLLLLGLAPAHTSLEPSTTTGECLASSGTVGVNASTAGRGWSWDRASGSSTTTTTTGSLVVAATVVGGAVVVTSAVAAAAVVVVAAAGGAAAGGAAAAGGGVGVAAGHSL